MSQPAQRRSLLPAQSVPREPLPMATVAAVAARNGFQGVEPPSPPPEQVAVPTGARRQRQPTGRDHQFNTRLRRDTLDYIYGEANGRNIPIAQVIEEGMEALRRERGQSTKP